VASKNNPNERKYNNTNLLVISEDCEKCIANGDACEQGKEYLKRLYNKGCGHCVPCPKKVN
jgi:hypothetical protein